MELTKEEKEFYKNLRLELVSQFEDPSKKYHNSGDLLMFYQHPNSPTSSTQEGKDYAKSLETFKENHIDLISRVFQKIQDFLVKPEEKKLFETLTAKGLVDNNDKDRLNTYKVLCDYKLSNEDEKLGVIHNAPSTTEESLYQRLFTLISKEIDGDKYFPEKKLAVLNGKTIASIDERIDQSQQEVLSRFREANYGEENASFTARNRP